MYPNCQSTRIALTNTTQSLIGHRNGTVWKRKYVFRFFKVIRKIFPWLKIPSNGCILVKYFISQCMGVNCSRSFLCFYNILWAVSHLDIFPILLGKLEMHFRNREPMVNSSPVCKARALVAAIWNIAFPSCPDWQMYKTGLLKMLRLPLGCNPRVLLSNSLMIFRALMPFSPSVVFSSLWVLIKGPKFPGKIYVKICVS